MKKILFFISFFSFGILFGQNLSRQGVGLITTNTPSLGTQEIFRFRPGTLGQLQTGTDYAFGANNKWFALGQVNTGGTQSFYGLRFQESQRGLVMGYSSLNLNNPRIQWIGDGVNLGDLEFRVANSFTSTASTLVATMTKFGQTIFGNSGPFGTSFSTSLVGINAPNTVGLNIFSNVNGLSIESNGSIGMNVITNSSGFVRGAEFETSGDEFTTGVFSQTQGGIQAIAIDAFASNAENSFGVRGTTFGIGGFEAAIYGETPNNGNHFAAFFDGETFSNTGWGPSDAKLKDNVTNEVNVLERLEKLRPVSYDYKKITEMNLPSNKQHGFISQELAEVFPELTKDISKPVFDKDGKIVSTFEFKAVNYEGLISVLTAGIQELNNEIKTLKDELSEYKSNEILRKRLNESQNIDVKGFNMDQNVPNPFTDQTQIRFQLPTNINKASIAVFDLNGKFIKEYDLNQNNGLLNIKSSDLGKGMFLYTLVYNGSEMITKKMIVR